MRGLVIICIFGLLLSGCVGTKIHTMPVKTFDASYDKVWDASIAYLNKEENPIVLVDKEKGIIATDWVNLQKVFSTKRYRYDIEIIKVGEDQVQVGIASPQEEYSMGDWEEMLPQERRAQYMFKAISKSLKSSSDSSKWVSPRPFNRRQRGLSR